MKRSGGSRPFRSLGSRMRSFGRSLMRHYVPAEEMPPLDMFAPGWQSAAETPLMWPEAPASNTPAATNEAEYFDAPEENIAPAAPRPRPAPARPTPAAPPPAQPQVQRKPAESDKGVQVNPILYELLAKNDAREAQRKRIREEKISAELQRQADPDALPIRRRGRMGVNYIETGTLSQGEEAPARPAKPAASEPAPPANEAAPVNPVQRQPQADADDGAEIFEDWNVDDDDVGGDDDDNGGTPPPLDPAPTPLTPPGIAQRFPDDSRIVSEESGDDFEVENQTDTPQNFADVSLPPAVETRRPAQSVQRDFQPSAPETFYDDSQSPAADDHDDGDYLDSEVSALGTLGEYGYEASAPDVTAQPPSQPIQRDYQAAAPDVPTQADFQQSEFFDESLVDDAYVEDGDTRPMPVQRAPVLPPPSFDEGADETGYDSLSDWVDAHSEPASPAARPGVQRDYQPAQSGDFDAAADDGAGDTSYFDHDDGDTRPMVVQQNDQPLSSPFADDDYDYEPAFDEAPYAAAPETEARSDVTAALPITNIQRQIEPETRYGETDAGEGDYVEADADDGDVYVDYGDPQTDDRPPQQNADSFNWRGDNNPPPANTAQRQVAPQFDNDVENFAADTGDYASPAPEFDDDGDYSDFDAPEQQQAETVYDAYRQPETDVQPADSPINNTVQRQPETIDDDHFAVENGDDYQFDAPEYGVPDENFDDDFIAPPEPGGYTEYHPPQADTTPDFAPPTQTIQRQPDSYDYNSAPVDAHADFAPPNTRIQRQPEAADETFVAQDSGEFYDEAEAYIPPVYGQEYETDSGETDDYHPAPANFQAKTTPDFAPPSNRVQRQPETDYDEAYTADDAGEFYGEAEAYLPPVYDETAEADTRDYTPMQVDSQPHSEPTQAVQRQAERAYDEAFADDGSEFDVNDYAAPVVDYEADSGETDGYDPAPANFQAENAPEYAPPTNTVQRQADVPDMVDDAPLYGDSGVADYADDNADYTYHRRDNSHFGDANTPSNTVQRQPDAAESVDDDDAASLYDSNYQVEYTEFIPAPRNIDTPSPADPVQRSEQAGGFEPTNIRPPPFYGDDVYETDISALLGGQPDPRPLQRRAELPDIAPETYYDVNETGDAVDMDGASVDLYQAMLQTGMVTPDSGFDNSPVEAAPPSIQRAADDQPASQPLDLFQAMMENGMVQADRDDDYDEADDVEPMSAATRMDLLSLLDTPAAPRNTVNQAQIVENAPSPVYQPPMVQRALNNETIEQPEQPEQSEEESDADVNVDQLARDVYNALRNRLRIERERRDHNR